MAVTKKPRQVRLPPGIGSLLKEPLLENPFHEGFMQARRKRFCLTCRTMGSMTDMGLFTCAKCGTEHNGRWGNLTAPRAFNNFLLLAGRGGGKTLIGAHAVIQELMIPGALWWAMGADYKLLWDSTFPTLVGLMNPEWVERWDPEHVEITLTNGSKVAFRSLEDPDRARGPHGVNGMWFDEAAKCPERAWHVGTPMLIKAGGIAIATTTVLGYDWTYDQLEKRALIYHEPGFWAARWKTLDNPLFRTNAVMREAIERHRRTMTPELFAQEYETERANATGLVYGAALIRRNVLENAEAVKRFIPEWPEIDPTRKVLIGLDEGGDHPFGAVLIVVTDKGLVVVSDYLERMKAHSAAHDDIWLRLGLHRFQQRVFSANKNALNLRLEWGLKGTGVIQAESKQEVGIQRVHSWLLTNQLKFAYTAQRTIDQMSALRYADNITAKGEKKEKEAVFKLKDELPDGVRYALMSFPELPDLEQPEMSESQQARWDAFSEKTKAEILRFRERNKDKDVLDEKDARYPLGEFDQRPVMGLDENLSGPLDDFTCMQ